MLTFFCRPLLFCVCACAVLMLSGPAIAAEKAAANKVPTSITAGGMEYNANAQIVLFRGNVHVKRPDFELWSDKMTIYLDKSTRDTADNSRTAAMGAESMQAGSIERIVAEKNVRLKSAENQGTCDKATYYAKDDKFVMEGSPILKDKGQNTITGKTVVHHLATNRSEVQGGVEAVFFTPDNTGRSPVPSRNSSSSQ